MDGKKSLEKICELEERSEARTRRKEKQVRESFS